MALPSIASVSRFTMESRTADGDGWKLVVDHGEKVEEGPAALPPGTRAGSAEVRLTGTL